MKNNLIEEDIIRIKKLINNVLRERFDLTNNKKIITEANTLQLYPKLAKYLGNGVVSKLKNSRNTNVLDNLETLFVKGEVNFVKNYSGQIVVKSLSGTEVPMTTISKALEKILENKITVDDVLNLLPKKLADGTEFRTVFNTPLKNIKKVTPITNPKPKPTGAGTGGNKGLSNLPLTSSVEDVMKHIDVEPIFVGIMKNKKGSREMVEKWIEVKIGDNVTPKQILKQAEEYFNKLQNSPDIKTVNLSKRIDKIIELAKKGDGVWEATKGVTKWGLAIGVVGIIAGAWTVKEFGNLIVCKLGWEKTNDWFGCVGGVTPQNKTKTELGGETNNNNGGFAKKGELD